MINLTGEKKQKQINQNLKLFNHLMKINF